MAAWRIEFEAVVRLPLQSTSSSNWKSSGTMPDDCRPNCLTQSWTMRAKKCHSSSATRAVESCTFHWRYRRHVDCDAYMDHIAPAAPRRLRVRVERSTGRAVDRVQPACDGSGYMPSRGAQGHRSALKAAKAAPQMNKASFYHRQNSSTLTRRQQRTVAGAIGPSDHQTTAAHDYSTEALRMGAMRRKGGKEERLGPYPTPP